MTGLLSCELAKMLWLCLAPVAAGAQAEAQADFLPLTPNLVAHTASRPAPVTKLRFEGQEYNVQTGRKLLVSLILEENTSVDRRCKALRLLVRVSGQLKGTSDLEELMKLYPGVSDRNSKVEILRCIIHSEDQRGLPFLEKVMKDDGDEYVRYFGAYGLATWNIRGGVEHLTLVLDSGVQGAPEGAAKFLQGLSRRKDWGFPGREVQEELMGMQDATREEKLAVWRDRWKVWFEANKHRFPEWSPPKENEQSPSSQPSVPGGS